jgi:hypothetical protein
LDELSQPEVNKPPEPAAARTTRRRISMFAPKTFYPDMGSYELDIFDLRIPGAAERYWSERMAWREAGDVEMLDEDHALLILRPGIPEECAA